MISKQSKEADRAAGVDITTTYCLVCGHWKHQKRVYISRRQGEDHIFMDGPFIFLIDSVVGNLTLVYPKLLVVGVPELYGLTHMMPTLNSMLNLTTYWRP